MVRPPSPCSSLLPRSPWGALPSLKAGAPPSPRLVRATQRPPPHPRRERGAGKRVWRAQAARRGARVHKNKIGGWGGVLVVWWRENKRRGEKKGGGKKGG